jgi:hypothetical protein
MGTPQTVETTTSGSALNSNTCTPAGASPKVARPRLLSAVGVSAGRSDPKGDWDTHDRALWDARHPAEKEYCRLQGAEECARPGKEEVS